MADDRFIDPDSPPVTPDYDELYQNAIQRTDGNQRYAQEYADHHSGRSEVTPVLPEATERQLAIRRERVAAIADQSTHSPNSYAFITASGEVRIPPPYPGTEPSGGQYYAYYSPVEGMRLSGIESDSLTDPSAPRYEDFNDFIPTMNPVVNQNDPEAILGIQTYVADINSRNRRQRLENMWGNIYIGTIAVIGAAVFGAAGAAIIGGAGAAAAGGGAAGGGTAAGGGAAGGGAAAGGGVVSGGGAAAGGGTIAGQVASGAAGIVASAAGNSGGGGNSTTPTAVVTPATTPTSTPTSTGTEPILTNSGTGTYVSNQTIVDPDTLISNPDGTYTDPQSGMTYNPQGQTINPTTGEPIQLPEVSPDGKSWWDSATNSWNPDTSGLANWLTSRGLVAMGSAVLQGGIRAYTNNQATNAANQAAVASAATRTKAYNEMYGQTANALPGIRDTTQATAGLMTKEKLNALAKAGAGYNETMKPWAESEAKYRGVLNKLLDRGQFSYEDFLASPDKKVYDAARDSAIGTTSNQIIAQKAAGGAYGSGNMAEALRKNNADQFALYDPQALTSARAADETWFNRITNEAKPTVTGEVATYNSNSAIAGGDIRALGTGAIGAAEVDYQNRMLTAANARSAGIGSVNANMIDAVGGNTSANINTQGSLAANTVSAIANAGNTTMSNQQTTNQLIAAGWVPPSSNNPGFLAGAPNGTRTPGEPLAGAGNTPMGNISTRKIT